MKELELQDKELFSGALISWQEFRDRIPKVLRYFTCTRTPIKQHWGSLELGMDNGMKSSEMWVEKNVHTSQL